MVERPHKRLHVWQRAMDLVELAYQVTQRLPDSERYGLTAQIRRAAVSVPTNIAEGAARHSAKETLQFYFIARGSLSELDTLVELGHRVSMMPRDDYEALTAQMRDISAMLQGLIDHGYRTQSLNHSISQSPTRALS